MIAVWRFIVLGHKMLMHYIFPTTYSINNNMYLLESLNQEIIISQSILMSKQLPGHKNNFPIN